MLKFRNSEKTILVTGSSSGIGKCIADTLSQQALKIYYHGKKHHDIDLPVNGKYLFGDLSKMDDVNKIISSLNGVDIDYLICSAGRTTLGPKQDDCLAFPSDVAHSIMDDIVFSATNICQKIVPLMIKRNFGKVFIIGGDVVDNPNQNGHMCFYGMAKAALHQYAQNLSAYLRGLNVCVTVNVVAPTGVDKSNSQNKDCLQRKANNKEVAELVRHLCLMDGNYLNGQVIRFNGGKK